MYLCIILALTVSQHLCVVIITVPYTVLHAKQQYFSYIWILYILQTTWLHSYVWWGKDEMYLDIGGKLTFAQRVW